MNKLKVLLMLLLTMFLFESTTLKSYAAITDISEIPEYSCDPDVDGYSSTKNYLTGFLPITEDDNNTKHKINIPEYSYVVFYTGNGNISLYEDEKLENKIISDNFVKVFLPKGDYYIYLDSIKFDYLETNLRYGRLSVEKLMRGKTEKFKKNFYYFIPGFMGKTHVEAMVTDYDYHYYDTDYDYTLTLKDIVSDKKKYKEIKYTMSLKNKSSNVSVKPSGTAKTILNKEKNNENSSDEEVSDTKKKDKKKPTVKGVKNNKTYKKTVKIKVSDKSGIKKVTLNGKKMKVSKFKKGYKITRKKSTKKYVLKVWDKAGNKRVVKFKIKKK